MKFKHVGVKHHFLTETVRVEPGQVVESDLDLATAFPDKFRRMDGGSEPVDVKAPEPAPAAANAVASVPEAPSQEKKPKPKAKPKQRRSSRRTG